jgi:hypothetical protein
MPPITWAIEDLCSPAKPDGICDKLAGKLGTRFEEVGLS